MQFKFLTVPPMCFFLATHLELSPLFLMRLPLPMTASMVAVRKILVGQALTAASRSVNLVAPGTIA